MSVQASSPISPHGTSYREGMEKESPHIDPKVSAHPSSFLHIEADGVYELAQRASEALEQTWEQVLEIQPDRRKFIEEAFRGECVAHVLEELTRANEAHVATIEAVTESDDLRAARSLMLMHACLVRAWLELPSAQKVLRGVQD